MFDPSKKAAGWNKRKKVAVESSLFQRMTEVRTTGAKDDPSLDHLNKFERAARVAPKKPAVVETAAIPRTSGGTVIDQKLAEAKTAFEQERATRREEVKAQEVRTARETHAPKLNQEDVEVLLTAFVARHATDLHPSEFNLNNLMNCMMKNIDNGKLTGWNLASFEAAFQFLNANGYIEPAIPRRGQDGTLTFPGFVSAVAPQQPQQATVQHAPVLSAEEQARLKAVPFDELQASVRSGYRKA